MTCGIARRQGDGRRDAPLPGAEDLADPRQDLVGVEIAHRHRHRVVGGDPLVVELHEVGVRHAPQVRQVPDDGDPGRMVEEEVLVGQVPEAGIGVGLGPLEFALDDLELAVEGLFLDEVVGHEVADDVDEGADLLAARLAEVADPLLAGHGVGLGADGRQAVADLVLGTGGRGAAGDDVFQQVRDAGAVELALVQAAGRDVDAEGRHPAQMPFADDDPQAVRQPLEPLAGLHRCRRRRGRGHRRLRRGLGFLGRRAETRGGAKKNQDRKCRRPRETQFHRCLPKD